MALRPVLEQSPETLCLVPSVWSNSLQLPVWCVGCGLEHTHVLADVCEHLNDGWMVPAYWTLVAPLARTVQCGASPVAGGEGVGRRSGDGAHEGGDGEGAHVGRRTKKTAAVGAHGGGAGGRGGGRGSAPHMGGVVRIQYMKPLNQAFH
jgi:hypothetical protein